MKNQHRIDIEQNKLGRLELLRAQRLFYCRAKLYQSLFALFALLLPVLSLLVGVSVPAVRPFLGLGSILVFLLDVGVFSRKVREDCKRGAKVQEQFDTEVLQMDWNRLIAGSRVDAEDVREIAPRPLQDAEKRVLENWYEPVFSQLPLPLGRLLCQRTNVTYDMRVRKAYSAILLGAAVLLIVVLTCLGLHEGLTVNELILTVYLPALPFVAFVLHEHRKQEDTIESLTDLKAEVEKVWDDALAGASYPELTTAARTLQDAIYRHRASNPLVFDWLYNWLRKRNEDLTRHAADRLVIEAKQTLKLEEDAQ